MKKRDEKKCMTKYTYHNLEKSILSENEKR
jgi:hypothetical protein